MVSIRWVVGATGQPLVPARTVTNRSARPELVVDVVLVLAMGWVLWVTAGAQAQEVAAATGNGRPGVMVIDGVRPARGADIPVGTFTDRDGTVTSEVAWQDRPATVGDRKACAWETGHGSPRCG